MNRELLRLAPAWVFLFILPFTHTVALRLMGLFAASLLAAWFWIRERPAVLSALPAWRWIAFWALLPLLLVPFSVDQRYSLGEVKTEVGYGVLALLVFFLGVRSETALRNSLRVLMAAYFVMTIWAIGSWLYLGSWRETSYFGGSASFSVYLVTVLPMLVLAWQTRLFGRYTNAVIALGLALGLIAGFLSEQRGFWFAAFLQVAFGSALLLRRYGTNKSVRLPLIGVLAFAAIAAAAMVWAVTSRFGTSANAGELITQDLRFRYWGIVLEWIAREPFTGHGFGRGMMSKAYPAEVSQMGMFWHAHNVILNYGFQLGLPGLAAAIGLFGALFVHWFRRSASDDPIIRAAGMAGALLVVGVVARNLTNDMFQRDLSLMFWALTGLLAGCMAFRTAART